jgi:hypothetical protein
MMTETLFVKLEETVACNTQMGPLAGGGVNIGRFKITFLDEVMNGHAGNAEKLSDIADFNQKGDGYFLFCGTKSNHGVDLWVGI